MIAYVTYNDPPSGIYVSQVIDTVRFVSKNEQVKLIAFVSMRNYKKLKREFKKLYPSILVLPAFPGIKNWKKNQLVLNYFLRKYKIKTAIGRGLFATDLLLSAKLNRVVFDARGAYKAEWEEFNFGAPQSFIGKIPALEKRVLEKSDFRIAVSKALTLYWKETYNYSGVQSRDYEIIPCTLSEKFTAFEIDENKIKATRAELGIAKDAIVLVYSGSVAGWQSIEQWVPLLDQAMAENDKVFALFLTKETPEIKALDQKYPNRVKRLWVDPNEVVDYLSIADIGLLLRNYLVTNKVASPTKFAEYLSVGLNVLISPEIGDYSDFVETHQCGNEVKDEMKNLYPTDISKRLENQKLAKEHFTKNVFAKAYSNCINSGT